MMTVNTNLNSTRLKLLIECCRHEVDYEILEYHAAEITEWDIFLDSAYVHGVFPLVHKALKAVTTVPEHVKRYLKTSNLEIARRNMTMTTELVKIMKLFEDNGIEVITFKGPVLSQIIHGDITQRQYADIDILLCNAKELFYSGELLIKSGYAFDYSLKFLKNKALLKIFKDVTFANSRVSLELHWKLFEDKFIQNNHANKFDFNAYFCEINGYMIRTLELDSLLFYLCIHGSKHFWERVEWIVDIDRLVRRNDIIDWVKIDSCAKVMKTDVMLYLGLALTHQLFDTPLPDWILNKIKKNHKVEKLVSLINEEFVNNPIIQVYEEKISWKYISMSSMIHDNWILAMKTFFKNIFQIKVEDVYLVNLPWYITPLYYVIRPFRLLKDYIKYGNERVQ
jgi:hypothetical protein